MARLTVPSKKALRLSTGKRHTLEVRTVIVRIDIDPEDPERHDDTFRLFTADGRYDKTLTVADDQVPGDEYLDLRFVGIPIDGRFSLEVDEGESGTKYLLFDDEPYESLT